MLFTNIARMRLFSLALPIGGLIAGSLSLVYPGAERAPEVKTVSLQAAESGEPIVEYYEPSVTAPSVVALNAGADFEAPPLPLSPNKEEATAPAAAQIPSPQPDTPIRTASLEDANPPAKSLLKPHATPRYTVEVEDAKPPKGWDEFCKHYTHECDVKAQTPRDIDLTPETWDKLVDINASVNKSIKPMTDMKHWHRVNKWTFAEDGYGDCKDYVLVKRRKLIEAGLPREALLITIVWTKQNQGHAVLIARTNKGDYVLDNLSRKVSLWTETSHDYVKRQSQTDPNAWVYIDGNSQKKSVAVASKAH